MKHRRFGASVALSAAWMTGGCQDVFKPAAEQALVEIDQLTMRSHATVRVMPVYPEASIRHGVEGVAVAAVRVAADGKVQSVELLQAPDPDIAAAVIDAAKQWVFGSFQTVGKERREPVRVDTKLTFYFRIGADGKGIVAGPELAERSVNSGSGSRPAAEIDSEGLAALSNKKQLRIIDVRSRGQFESGHREAAVNIPIDELSARASELAASTAIVIDCFPGRLDMCRLAARTLTKRVAADVLVLVRE